MDNPAFHVEEGETGVPSSVSVAEVSQKSPEKHEEGFKWSYVRQIFCAAVTSSGLYVISFLIGSTSMLPGLLTTNSNNISYTSEDLKWLASAPLLATVPADFLAVVFIKYFGPTYVFRVSLILSFLVYILMALQPTLAVVAISRVALFILVGVFDIVCMPLVAELSEPSIRGLCGALPELTTSFGILFVFITFTFLNGPLAIICCSIPVLLGFLASFFVPQSPYWLVQRGRKLEAAQSFARVIGPSRKERQKELLQETVSCYEKNNEDNLKKNQIKLLGKSRNWKPLLLTLAIFACREFGGHNVIFFYALQIFQEADISFDSFFCTIIVGAVRVFSTFLSSLFQDKLGRRIVLIGSTFVSGLCLLTAGLILFYDVPALKVVPLIAIIVLILMTGVGMGPVPFILLGELIPSEVKFSSTSIVFAIFSIYQFVTVVVTPTVLEFFSVGPVFLVFSTVNVITSIILYFILPETRYKTLTELESLFK